MKSELIESKNLFATPFWVFRMDENFRKTLLNFFVSHFNFSDLPAEYNDYNIFKENFGAQELDLLKEEAHRLVQVQFGPQIANQVQSERAWICGSGPNYYMRSHNHANSTISTVFYFQVNKSGPLIFHDPRVNANRGYGSEFQDILNLREFTWTPSTGDIIMFPSYMYHSVLPHREADYRVAVALDFFMDS